MRYHANYVEARLNRARAALRRVTDAVEDRWRQSHPGVPLPNRGAAELAASAGVSPFTVEAIELLTTLVKEIFTAINKSVAMEPLPLFGRLYVRRELRKAVKSAERSASDIVARLNRLDR
jgi:hypothetical protein